MSTKEWLQTRAAIAIGSSLERLGFRGWMHDFRPLSQIALTKGFDGDALARVAAVARSFGLMERNAGGEVRACRAWTPPDFPVAPDDAQSCAYYEEFVFPFLEPAVLLAALQSGKSQWNPFLAYGKDPAKLQRFMSWMNRRNAAELEHAAKAFRQPGGSKILDVGGGGGAFAAALVKEQAWLQAVDIYELESALPVLAAVFAAQHGASAKIRYLGGDFLQPAVHAGLSGLSIDRKYEAAALSWVLHDWPDEAAIEILSRIKGQLHPGSELAVIELLRDEANVDASFLDLLMLMHTGGRERTFAEYASLLERAGFVRPRHVPLAGRRQLIAANAPESGTKPETQCS